MGKEQRYDVLIIGAGIAGLSLALKIAAHKRVCVLAKNECQNSNTACAQGGIAAALSAPDSFDKHVQDTLVAGDGLCNEGVVRRIVEKAPKQIQTLIDWGVEFDKQEDGSFDLHKEGGHSEHRILHARDLTGREIQDKLLLQVKAHKQIDFFEHAYAVDLITQHHLGRVVYRWYTDIACYGAYVIAPQGGKVYTVLADTTVLATGGIGNIYQTSTNPRIATGDGIAMAYRAKAIIEGMEFVQFHPTALYNPGDSPAFLITEAMRGFGAVLRTRDGKEFMHKYDKRGCLAPRDIVARAIDNEMKNKGDDFVYLDVRHKEPEEVKKHFPNIYAKCMSIGLDITTEYIPVAPAAHYLCGGIKVNEQARTSIQNLFAIGECASTGLHGANRLASNSLMEGVVSAEEAAQAILSHQSARVEVDKIPAWNDEGTSLPEEMILITQSKKELEQIMSNYVGIVRSNLRLKRALDRLWIIYGETERLFDRSVVSREICELRNAINVAYLVIKMARDRKESRGLHYTLDYPMKNKIV